MSRPPNPLAKFNSYSYHHILVACDNSLTAESLFGGSTPSNAIFTPSAIVEAHDGNITTSHVQGSPSGGKYVMIMNGLNNAQFVIDEINWSLILAAPVVEGDRSNNVATEGTMIVIEPRGMLFMKVLATSAQALGVNPSDVVWLLKTIFVGHDATTGTDDTILNIEPLYLTFTDMVGEFDFSGGRYTISFIALTDGASRLPQIAQAAQGVTFPAKANGSLKISDVLTAFANNLNKLYAQDAACIKQFLNKSAGTNTDNTRGVIFTIDCPDNSDGKGYNQDKYKYDQPQQTTSNAADNTNPVISFGPNISIESAIEQIMRGSSAVLTDTYPGTGDSPTQAIFRILSNVRYTDKNVEITYQVVRAKAYRQPDANTIISKIKSNASTSGTTASTTPPGQNPTFDGITDEQMTNYNLFQLDYIYTGKNIDITNFEMKMNMGLTFFYALQSTTNAHSTPSTGHQASHTYTGKNDSGYSGVYPKELPRNTVIWPTLKNSDVTINATANPGGGLNYINAMNRHAALETTEAKVEILGNPNLLGVLAASAVPTPATTAGVSSPRTTFHESPMLVKINVKMPTSNVNVAAAGDLTDFWYTGLYQILSIDQKFSGGVFTQILNLVGLAQGAYTVDADTNEHPLCQFVPSSGTTAATTNSSGQFQHVPFDKKSAGDHADVVTPRTTQ